MRFDIITIFPEMFGSYFKQSEKKGSPERSEGGSYFNASILKKAQKKRFIKIYIHNLRKWTIDRHQTTDDCPYGGGMGMIFKVEPIFKAVKVLKKKRIKKSRIILFSAKGKKLTQKKVKQLSKYDQLILICPRYEGVDERVAKHIADEEISIGQYILTGGELPAMALVDAVSRFVPGVIKKESLLEESFSIDFEGKGEYPQYTRPEVFYPNKKKISWRVPNILLSGNHKKIKEWRRKHLKKI